MIHLESRSGSAFQIRKPGSVGYLEENGEEGDGRNVGNSHIPEYLEGEEQDPQLRHPTSSHGSRSAVSIVTTKLNPSSKFIVVESVPDPDPPDPHV
jgi:hypothetical protein